MTITAREMLMHHVDFDFLYSLPPKYLDRGDFYDLYMAYREMFKTDESLGMIVLPPLRAIRKYCLGCRGSAVEVKQCDNTQCSLYEFRSGHKPRQTASCVPFSDEEASRV